MKLSILVYSTTKDTFSGQHFINTTNHYAHLPSNANITKTLARNIACRFRYTLISSVATTSLITNFVIASLLRLTNIFTNSLQPLSKKLYTYSAAHSIILGLCIKGSILGPQFITRIPSDIDQTETNYINRKIKRFRDEFHDVPENHEYSNAIHQIEGTIQNLWTVTSKEQVGSLEYPLSRYDHLNEFDKRYSSLFEITKTFRDKLILRN